MQLKRMESRLVGANQVSKYFMHMAFFWSNLPPAYLKVELSVTLKLEGLAG